MNTLVVPDSGLELSVGDLVMLERFPGTKWTVNYGWYTYNTYQAMGWYFCAIPTKTVLPASGDDLASVTLLAKAASGCCNCNPYGPPPGYPPTSGTGGTTDGTTGSGTGTDSSGTTSNNRPYPTPPPPTPIPPELIKEVDRAFITVDTIAQRDMLSSMKMLPHGKLVKVNYTPYDTVKYYSWNLVCQQWDEVDFAGSDIDTDDFLTDEEAADIYITKEAANDTFVTASMLSWEPI